METAPRSILEIYEQYVRRREAIIKALIDGMCLGCDNCRRYSHGGTFWSGSVILLGVFCVYTDRSEFYEQCDPEKENLCLYGACLESLRERLDDGRGRVPRFIDFICAMIIVYNSISTHKSILLRGNGPFQPWLWTSRDWHGQFRPVSLTPLIGYNVGNPDGTWSVDLPAAEVPPEMPEPVLGINFARNGMAMNDWLSLCAIHSDSWLMALLFFFGARFNCTGRAELFALANQHPTIYEVVTDKVPRNVMYKRQDGGETYLPISDASKRMTEPAIRSQPSGKIIGPNDFSTALCGKRAELFWPDDRKWYLVEIQAIDMDTKMAKVRYATNEEEELNLMEVIEDGQMSLLG